ncbi:NfeD family protein [Shewanella marina]|uniref:NfeD family protein n=1 Tax=Shewanella marina TaxID=487319 RepID=UPI000569650E|nr:NfeD family protein [Shewanella marina]
MFENSSLIWAALGVLLMLAEIIIPGGIVIFLGIAAILVAGLLFIGIISGLPQSLICWFILSIVLLLVFRQVTQKLIGGDQHIDNTDEELDIYNQIAVVKEAIGPGQQMGRIEFMGSQWSAKADGSIIAVGQKVRVICRDNIGLIVEPIKSE